MRMFVAVLPPAHVVEDLEEFLEPRREAAAFRWSPPEQWHLTLAFSGNVPDRAYDDVVERLGRAATRRTPMRLRVLGGGAFPDAGRARVLYAGLETGSSAETEELRRASVGAHAALAKAGADVDGRRFRPHLTLARMNRPAEASNWVRLLDAYAGPAWQVEEIGLVASYLGEGPRNRPRHEVVETFSLGRAGSAPAPPSAPRRGR